MKTPRERPHPREPVSVPEPKPDLLRRINVVGSSGTGKSTFSARLARALSLPRVEMDALFWGANWTQPEDNAFFGSLEAALRGDSWVLDGNYSRTVPIKWRHVQTVIWLDFSFALTTARAVRRAFFRALTRQELWPGTGNRESFIRSFLSRDSIILWSIQNHQKIRERYARAMTTEAYSHIQFIRLTSPAAAERFLVQLNSSAAVTRPQNRLSGMDGMSSSQT